SKAKRWIGRSFSFVVEGKLPDALPIPDSSTLPPEADEDTAVESPQGLVGLAIGPNPATTFLNIYCNEGLLGRTIKLAIYDTLGQQVFVTEKSAESVYTIQTSSWPKGLYILQAYCEGRRVVHRFMVQ
ncbi:MAG: T9SS type A sorting domain-containing protein, partial [Bacteroides sp.]